jgi:hypothetical protein
MQCLLETNERTCLNKKFLHKQKSNDKNKQSSTDVLFLTKIFFISFETVLGFENKLFLFICEHLIFVSFFLLASHEFLFIFPLIKS